MSNLKVFRCKAMVHLPKEKRKKWDPKAHKMIFIGYCENTKGYRFTNLNCKEIVKSCDTEFLESSVKRDYASLELSEKEKKNEINNSSIEENRDFDNSYIFIYTIL